MQRLWPVAGAVAILCGASASCVETCVPGETEPCACTDGRGGAQICRANGTFEPCVCSSKPDGGADGGLECMNNRSPPQIGVNLIQPRVSWRIASGQRIELRVQVQDFDNDPLTRSWSVHAEDAGPGSDGPDASITVVAIETVQISVAETGRWVIELVASDGCHESSRTWPIDVLPAKKLPFAVSDVVCCDATGRAFAIAPLTAKVMRLDMDGGVDATQTLPRIPKSLSLDAERTRLVVAQDAYVSFFHLEDFSREVEWPVGFSVNAAIASGDSVWLYGAFSRALQLSIDAGTVVGMSSSAEDVRRGFMSADGGWLVFTSGSQAATLPVRNALVQRSGGVSSCGQLWSTQDRSRFFSACGEAFELQRDGGLGYSGTLRAQTQFEALSETTTGSVAASYVASQDEARLRFMNGSSLTVQADFVVGLQSSDLREVLPPGFLIPSSGGGVHALTPDSTNDVTWWQEY